MEPCSLVSPSGKGTGRDVSPYSRALTGINVQMSWLLPRGWGTCGDMSKPWLLLTPSILSSQTWWFSKGWIFFQLFKASGPSFSSLSHLPEPCAYAAGLGTGGLGLLWTEAQSLAMG